MPTLPNLTIPAQLGYQLPLDGSAKTTGSQSYTVTSDNPDIQAAIAQGSYWTLNVQHTASSSSDVTFSGSVTFQLFQDLTPSTVAHIVSFTNAHFYDGKDIFRVFSTPNGFLTRRGST